MEGLLLITLYGWPIVIGLFCLVVSRTQKIKTGIYVIITGYVCLLSALMLLWLTSVFAESVIVPHAYSTDCVTRSDGCNLTLLGIGDWLEQWSFLFFEMLGFLVALALSYRKVRLLKTAG